MNRLSTVGDRAFPVAAARLWNSLPSHVAAAPLSLHLPLCKFLLLRDTFFNILSLILIFCFVISSSISVRTVVPVSVNGLGISRGFTVFPNR